MGNLFENFKIDILSALSSQLDFLQVKKKQEKNEELEKSLVVFSSKMKEETCLEGMS